MNWRDVWTARRSRIGSLVEKDISFLVPILRECGRSKQILYAAWDLLTRNPVAWRSSCFQMVQLGSKRSPHTSWRMIDSSTMREVDSLNDRCVHYCYLTRNFDKTRIGIAQTCLFTFGMTRWPPPVMSQGSLTRSLYRMLGYDNSVICGWYNGLDQLDDPANDLMLVDQMIMQRRKFEDCE